MVMLVTIVMELEVELVLMLVMVLDVMLSRLVVKSSRARIRRIAAASNIS